MWMPKNESAKIIKSKINVPRVCNHWRILAYFGASRSEKTNFEPSSGGIGIKLKSINTISIKRRTNKN